MRPEAAAGAQEARGHRCHCLVDGPGRPLPPRGPESSTPWRPWSLTSGDAGQMRTGRQLEPGGDQQTFGSKGAFGFQHPVRLYLPISKCQEYLQSSGEKVLASFPVQATIHFYNDGSDSDDEEGEEEMEEPSALHCQEAEDRVGSDPGGKCRELLMHQKERCQGSRGLHGKDLLSLGDTSGKVESFSPK
ncbi:PREDICTED: protein ripply3 [Chrysochloris asiatica]|uniref:Protein ripply3 n=1 Tax=Chrysochloris asiatica TaxID=185453 RepID=A0A9B0TLK4_CHRAS|nr:PREDICTED: protein ripply3 [Chrysochloris asiatica]